MRSVIKTFIYFTVDLLAAAAIISGVWIVNYKVPRKMRNADVIQNPAKDQDDEAVMAYGDDAGGLHEKFSSHFTDTVVVTEDSYSDPDISVSLSFCRYDTGKETGSGQFGSCVSYVLADVYVGDITRIRTAFPQDVYGTGYAERLVEMSMERGAVLGINGDSCTNDLNKDNGTIIRNGVLYRDRQSASETCVLNLDGTIQIYEPYSVDMEELIENGAYQSWVFGPSLLDENGKAKEEFCTYDYIRESHPRTAIGYYEPGHYCFLVVDGRQENSRGMFLDEMAKLFEDLGCRTAYNLDGGHCSFMAMQDRVVSHPYDPGQKVMDGIFLIP